MTTSGIYSNYWYITQSGYCILISQSQGMDQFLQAWRRGEEKKHACIMSEYHTQTALSVTLCK